MAGKKPRDLTPHELFGRIDAHATPRDYRHKQAIFAQGDKADAMFYIQGGNVKLTVASKDGKKAVIAILRQGDFFGEGCCLVRQSLRMSSATAIQPSTVARVKRVTIVRSIHEDPAFAKLLISHLLSRIKRIEEDFVDQILSSSEKRLARILLALAGLGLQSKQEAVFRTLLPPDRLPRTFSVPLHRGLRHLCRGIADAVAHRNRLEHATLIRSPEISIQRASALDLALKATGQLGTSTEHN